MKSLYRTVGVLEDGVVVTKAACRECGAKGDMPRRPRQEPEVDHAENCWLRGVPPREACH